MMFKMLDTIFEFRNFRFFMIFQNFQRGGAAPLGGWIWTNMERAQLGPPMVHMTKFDQIRLKDLGVRRVDDRHTHKQTQAIVMAILRIRPTNSGKNKGPSGFSQIGPTDIQTSRYEDMGSRPLLGDGGVHSNASSSHITRTYH